MQRATKLSRMLLMGYTLLCMPLQPSLAREKSADTMVEVAAERAHFAQEFCKLTPAQTVRFKEQIKAALSDSQNFDAYWQTGWNREEHDAIALRLQRDSDPTEYAKRVKTSCSRVKWQAENSLRTRPHK